MAEETPCFVQIAKDRFLNLATVRSVASYLSTCGIDENKGTVYFLDGSEENYSDDEWERLVEALRRLEV